MNNTDTRPEAAFTDRNSDFFCRRILKGCRYTGMNLKQLSQQMNIPYAEMKKILDGGYEIPHDFVWKVSICMELPLSFFYGNDEATELIDAYLKITRDNLAKEILSAVIALSKRRRRN